MSDLARQAAEEIASTERPFCKHEDVVLDIETTINRHGTLVSHEDAALLREVKRLAASVTDAEIVRNKRGWFVSLASDSSEVWHTGDDDTLTAALKSALDAAGVPDEKGE